jgi:23S rRNA (adenine1618-N6)-methyltransferase
MKKGDHHPRNKHRGRYDFKRLVSASPELEPFIRKNPDGESTILFDDPKAVKALNHAILRADYGVGNWDVPEGYLCPAIPGRADYVHAIADLLAEENRGKIPTGTSVRVLDIGTGANVVYPLIARSEYDWHVTGSDSDPVALKAAKNNLSANPKAASHIELREQTHPRKIFSGIILPGERYDLTLCNPPFHASLEEAAAGSQRKWKNLGKDKGKKPTLNFGGRESEIVTDGGEREFILRMISESKAYAKQVHWFTTLVSKETNLPAIEKALIQAKTSDMRLIEMLHGQKKTRIVAWNFRR